MERTSLKSTRPKVTLTPVEGGTIIVFNTIQQGNYGQLWEQINLLKEEFDKKNIQLEIEMFTAFGPFDNVIRLDVDDFCVVNRISSLAGVSSQQIQCAYSIWSTPGLPKTQKHEKPFCCITQLKVQNHLMLGHGPEIEEAIAQLITQCLIQYLEKNPDIAQDIEVELMATLGWDEFFVFMRNSRGYASMFKPILEEIRPLTIQNLEALLQRKFTYKSDNPDAKNQQQHLFLSTYSTPAYSASLNEIIEAELVKMVEEKEKKIGHDLKSVEDRVIAGHELESRNPLKFPENFGADKINVSMRLSIKPGHEGKVSRITNKVMENADWGYKEAIHPIDKIFSIGRYDVYPMLDAQMTCKQFITYFELLAFSLAGNLKKGEEYSEFLKQTQYYNSYTVISYLQADNTSTEELKNTPIPILISLESPGELEYNNAKEGGFVSQLSKLSLSYCGEKDNKKTIRQVFNENDLLKNRVPESIVSGLSRIFSLFDSCIMDRFTCDSFIDMYPFMQRIRTIIDTVKEKTENPGTLLFSLPTPNGSDFPPPTIDLPESWENSEYNLDPLVRVFYTAILRFSRGFVHRYLSSYPMMDKNETGVDFSGRLHRILSAVTGMQNLLLDDLDCHIKKGFNSISTRPGIRIHRGSFNTTEATVFHLFQVESFFILFHESIHTFIHSKERKGILLLNTLEEPIKSLKEDIPEESLDICRLILEEITGDLFALRNACYGNYHLFSFWYWLLLIQCKNKIDSQILLRFLVISYHLDHKSRAIIDRYLSLDVIMPAQLKEMMDELLPDEFYPNPIKTSIKSRIDTFVTTHINADQKVQWFFYAFNIVSEMFYAIHLKLDNLLESYCYAPGNGAQEYQEQLLECPILPQNREHAANKKRQESSIRLFRCLLTFIYQNREYLWCEGDGILNFQADKTELRKKLFKYRITLTNTLQWESLCWKKSLLEDKEINFPMGLRIAQGE